MVECKDKFKRMACFSKKAMSAVLSAAMVCMTMTSVYVPTAGVVYAAEETNEVSGSESGGGATVVAGGGSLTVNNAVAGHRYRVYQIFTGNVNADGTTLSNIKYGKNYGETGTAVPNEELEGIEDAKAFAKKLASDNTGGGITGEPVTVLTVENTSAQLEPGYYLVIDEITDGSTNHGDAVSDFIVEVVGNKTFTPKSTSVPTFDKMIEGEIACDHVWNETITKEATCTEGGEKKLVCESCGETKTEVIPKTEHEYENDKCKNCGEAEYQAVTLEEFSANPVLKRKPAMSLKDLGTVTVNDENVKSEDFGVQGVEVGSISEDAGGEEGTEYVKFKEAGDYDIKVETDDGSGNTIIINIYITINNSSETHVHKWTETVTKEPTCDEDGEKKLVCDGCGDIRTERIPATGHDYGDDGICKNCGEHEHNYVEEITKEPTCSEEGEKTYTCECGDVKTEKIPATGEHDYEEKITKEPTCSEDGEKELTCRVCGDKKTEAIPTTGEHFDNDGDCICDSCGAIAHSYEAVKINPTITLLSKSGSGTANASGNTYNIRISTPNSTLKASYQIVIPYSGNYLCTDIGGASNGVGSSYSGNKFGMTQDPGCNLMKSGTGTRYMAKGTYKFSFDLGLGGNSGAYTDYSHRVEAKDTHNRCKVCGHMEGDEETIEVAMVQNLFPVSMAAEENADEVSSDAENGTDVITPSNDTDTTVKYGIGDSVPFRLTAVMPESISVYDSYKLVFHDTMSDGMTYDENSLKVFAGDAEISADNYTLNFDGQSFTVTINNVKAEPYNASAGSEIIVKYTATLNDSALFRNLNDAYLQYSNNPNDANGMGTTVSDEVTAFTFTVEFDKVDGKSGDALDGAGFTLYKKNDSDGSYAVIRDEVTGGTAFSFSGLGTGDYKLVESTTPDGYNTMEDLEFSIVADSKEDADGNAYVTALKIVSQGSDLNSEMIDGWQASVDTGILNSDIANFKGSELPSTGGIGTTAFYAVGGVIVLAVCIVLIRKRKEQAV